MSKFEYGKFEQDDGYSGFAIPMKFPREEADRIFLEEMDEPLEKFRVVTGYAQYHFGVDDSECGYDRGTEFESTKEVKECWDELPMWCEGCGAKMDREEGGENADK